MNHARRSLLALASVWLALSSASTLHAATWAQKSVKSGKLPIRNACIMPVEAGITKIGVRTSESLTTESDAWAAALQGLLETQFKSMGIAATSATNPLSSGASAQDIREAVQQIQQKFDALSQVMNKKPKEIAKNAYTLGDQVAMLPCAATSDVLVFIRGAGAMPTPGRQTMAFAGGVAVWEGALVNITLADAKSGQILAMMRFRNTDDFLTYEKGKYVLADEQEAFGNPLLDALADINLGSARKLQEKRDFPSPGQ